MNRTTWILVALGNLVLAAAAGLDDAAAQDPTIAAREQMVDEAVRGGGITHPGVIDAVRSVPRHLFVDRKDQPRAYFDMAIPIGHGQTISPPYIVAFMTAQLDPLPTDKVLEIGTGSGYQAAVLSPLVKEVYTIEIVTPLGEAATKRLKALGYDNVFVKIGDGYQGWAEHAPFQKIIVTCSPENVPQPLIDQLDEGGLMVVPVGERFQQTLYRFRKRSGKLEQERLQATFFVPMTGKAESARKVLPDLSRPEIFNGGFEELAEGSELPTVWYYLRQARVTTDSRAPEGQHVLEFENHTAGRPSSTLQSFGVDGQQVHVIDLTCSVAGQHIVRGNDRHEVAGIGVEFYSESRAAVGQVMAGPFSGTFPWKQVHKRIPVPKQAKLAVVGAGLFGATGKMQVDDIRIVSQQDEPTVEKEQ